jgi:glycosidase
MPDGPGSGDIEKRTPMRWAAVGADGSFGFTTGSPWTDPGPGQPGVSVAEQVDEPGSLLSRYRRLIALRNERDALRSGVWSVLRTSSRAVLAVERVGADETLLVLANLAARAVELGADELAGYYWADAVTGAELQAGEGGGLSLPGLSLYVLRAR